MLVCFTTWALPRRLNRNPKGTVNNPPVFWMSSLWPFDLTRARNLPAEET